MSKRSKCCIIGIPDHQGVIHVGGRVGAARGPAAFRELFFRLNGKNAVQKQVLDEGDVSGLGSDIACNHKQAADFIEKAHRSAQLSVVVGGGHDHGYSQLLGISRSARQRSNPKRPYRLGCINIDAHLDVRKPNPWITSGSPFFLALESQVIESERFLEFGIQSHCNSPDLWEYAESRHIRVVPFHELRHGQGPSLFKKYLKKLAVSCDQIVISLDMDAFAAAFSPGVSAPQSEGFTPMEGIEMLEIAGQEKKVVSLGIFELNPEHDSENRSARLAATCAYHFIDSALN